MITRLIKQNILDEFENSFGYVNFFDTDNKFVITLDPSVRAPFKRSVIKKLTEWGFKLNGDSYEYVKKVHPIGNRLIQYNELENLQYKSLTNCLLPSYIDSNGNIDIDGLEKALIEMAQSFLNDLSVIKEKYYENNTKFRG